MSVEHPQQIDGVAVDVAGAVCRLTIIDHLPWDEEHLLTLQRKINRYVQFIQSGELFTADPDAADCELVITVSAIYAPTAAAGQFIEKAQSVLEDVGIGLAVRPLGSAYADLHG